MKQPYSIRLETFLRTFPGRLLVPTFEDELLDKISTTFNQAAIGIAFNVELALHKSDQYLQGVSPDGPFRPFHRSFAEFLPEDPTNSPRRPTAWCGSGRCACSADVWSSATRHAILSPILPHV